MKLHYFYFIYSKWPKRLHHDAAVVGAFRRRLFRCWRRQQRKGARTRPATGGGGQPSRGGVARVAATVQGGVASRRGGLLEGGIRHDGAGPRQVPPLRCRRALRRVRLAQSLSSPGTGDDFRG